MICAIYARVSTKAKSAKDMEKQQDTENQLIELRAYCERKGWIPVEYVDRASGKNSDREAFQRLFEDAAKRRFDVVVVWALDRLTREGVYETFTHVRRLTDHGIAFESYTEEHFRTTGPAGELMLAVAAWIAKQERLRISDRTKAGMKRAKAAGKVCHRPVKVFNRGRAVELRELGMSWRGIAKELGVPFSTVRRALAKTPAKS